MTPREIQRLPQYNGIYFDRASGKTYYGDDQRPLADTGYTFEAARWTGPWLVNPILAVWTLNPIGFATHETAVKILAFARRVAPPRLLVNLDERDRSVGPFSRTPERLIVVTRQAKKGDEDEVTDDFSAGWLASSIIRHGEKRAGELWLFELRAAGLVR